MKGNSGKGKKKISDVDAEIRIENAVTDRIMRNALALERETDEERRKREARIINQWNKGLPGVCDEGDY